MCNIIFLGTGGGRINMLEQFRKTGGFLIQHEDLLISVDPGPGALSGMHLLGFRPQKIDCVICTHMHIDHVLEAPLLIEAMSGYMLKRGGTLISSKETLLGDENGDRSITLYHQSKLERNIVFSNTDARELSFGDKGFFKITGVPVKHDDKSGFGFILEINGYKIGYTSDTEYIPQIHNVAYAGVDVLIANCLKPYVDGIPDHMYSGHLAKLLSATKPKVCIMSHMGMKLIRAGPEAEAAKIESESKVKTIAGRDYYCYGIKTKKWGKYKSVKNDNKSQTRL